MRFVYQPLDELYIVLITNRQSNILQDIDSLHLFAQVTTSICRSLDEREILRNAFELLSAFDELVTLGYRENLSLSQIKTFLEMESHEERIQEIIERVCISRRRRSSQTVVVGQNADQDTPHYRTRNLRLAKNAKERPSSWRCNGRRHSARDELRHQEPHLIPFTALPRVLLSPTPTIHMKRRRRSRLPSMCASRICCCVGIWLTNV